ncbi:MAG: class I SAM-dependent methyltransferase [Phycisphaerae bacterium]|nr:class I SAM-dependent methyltransferase [Phycisphaerae bacterium]
MTAPTHQLIASRASAYDAIYAHWRSHRFTRESYESNLAFFLDMDASAHGYLNGDELRFAYELLGTDSISDKTVLDCCCGTGKSTVYLALRGARVHAFDSSRQAIAVAKESADLSGVADRVQFAVQDAQYLPYADGSFDAVFCQSALHIVIDYPRCARELARVLKPGGMAVFCEEALGHNPLLKPIRWYRRRKYVTCGGRALTCQDLRRFGAPFQNVCIYHFNLLAQSKTLLGGLSRHPWIKTALRRCAAWDKAMLARWPALRRYCGKVVVAYRNPCSS